MTAKEGDLKAWEEINGELRSRRGLGGRICAIHDQWSHSHALAKCKRTSQAQMFCCEWAAYCRQVAEVAMRSNTQRLNREVMPVWDVEPEAVMTIEEMRIRKKQEHLGLKFRRGGRLTVRWLP